jgi:hypothetical protein
MGIWASKKASDGGDLDNAAEVSSEVGGRRATTRLEWRAAGLGEEEEQRGQASDDSMIVLGGVIDTFVGRQ